jgi:putative transposase
MNALQALPLKGLRVTHNGKFATVYPAGDKASIIYDDRTSTVVDFDVVRTALAKNELAVVKDRNPEAGGMDSLVNKASTSSRKLAYVHDARRHKHHRNKNTLKKSIKYTAQRIADIKPPKWRTVYDWIVQADQQGVNAFSSVPKQRKRDSRIPEEIENLMWDSLDDHLSRHPNPSRTGAFKLFKSQLKKLGYEFKVNSPFRTTFFKRCNKIMNYEWLKKTLGRDEAKKYMRCAMSELKVNSPNELVQIDAVHPNIILKDEEGRKLGKPVIHMAIDVFSRSIIGFSIEILKKESSAGVIECLKHSMLEKENLPYCLNGWPQHGHITELAQDGGSAYTSREVESFLSYLHVTPQKSETRTPWAKGIIERFFGTLRSQCLSSLDGYIPRRQQDVSSDAVRSQKAFYTPEEFRIHLTKYIVDFYHHQPHSALGGQTPAQMWNKGTDLHPPMPVNNLHQALLLQGISQTRVLDLNKGITVGNARYQSRELQKLHQEIRQSQRTGTIRIDCLYNPADISEITVISEKPNMLFKVPTVNSIISKGMSAAEYKAILKEQKHTYDSNDSKIDCYSTYLHSLKEDQVDIEGNPTKQEEKKAKPTKLSRSNVDSINETVPTARTAINSNDPYECAENCIQEESSDGWDSQVETDDAALWEGI